MFSKKLLLKTFGAKIKPYGFEFTEYVCRRYTFSRTVDGKDQTFVIQNDPGGHSLQLEIETHAGRWWEIRERFWDLVYHSYENSRELENILNVLGDHVVNRVIPMLAELSIPKIEYTDMLTEEIYSLLEKEKDGAIQRFMMRNKIDAEQGTDVVMENLLREVERIKGCPFQETIDVQIELAAVYGHIILCDIGGEWIRGRKKLSIEHCPFSNEGESPLDRISECCQKGGGVKLAARYVALVKKHRENVTRERRKYGDNWEPPRTSNEVNESLMSESILKEALLKRLEDIGFYYSSRAGRFWWIRRKTNQEEMGIRIEEELCRRKTFFITLYTATDGHVGEYMYKKFYFYQDEADLCEQLEHVGDEIREAIREGRRIADLDRERKECHPTDGMRESFRTRRAEMAENFWKRNGLDQASKEEDILYCIVKEMDSIADNDYLKDRERLGDFYKANQEQLMELSAAYGELIIREIGGKWAEDEDWRMKHRISFLEEVPAIGRVALPVNLIQYWENGGSRRLLWEYQEYKWAFGEWKRLCRLAGIETQADTAGKL